MTSAFDEMTLADGNARPGYEFLRTWLDSTPIDQLNLQQAEAELLFRRIGVTFAVYGTSDAEERIIPFDIIPRILSKNEWGRLSKGLEQRVKALNAFLADIYSGGEILRAGIVPADLVYQNPYFRPEMVGVRLPHNSYVQIAGDLVFTKNGRSFARPLILTTRENMMSVYEEGYDFETRIFRRRPQT